MERTRKKSGIIEEKKQTNNLKHFFRFRPDDDSSSRSLSSTAMNRSASQSSAFKKPSTSRPSPRKAGKENSSPKAHKKSKPKSKKAREPSPSESESESDSEAEPEPPVVQKRKPTKTAPTPAKVLAVKTVQGPKPTGAARRKQGSPRLRQIIQLQESTQCQIPKAPFARVVREVMQHRATRGNNMRITPEALEALRESAEVYLTTMFTDANLIVMNRNQVTVQPRDVQLLMFLRGPEIGRR